MDEADLQVFIEGTTHYFNQSSSSQAELGTPYLTDDNKNAAMEFTGIIGVSGRRKGSVFFSARQELLDELLSSMGETEQTEENRCDLVGEVANTISGNARREFGSDFMISVPVVVAGKPDGIKNPPEMRSYVIPIAWKTHEASLVICLE